MIKLAENGVTCECGESRFAPAEVTALEPVICAACGRTFKVDALLVALPDMHATARMDVVLEPLNWQEVADHFEHRPWDLCAFEWVRAGVPPEARARVAALESAARAVESLYRPFMIATLGAVAGLVALVLR